jgi:hypothetical protein
MAEPGRYTDSEDGKWWRKASDFSHIPTPYEVTWVGDWHFSQGCYPEHDDWIRFIGGRSWTVEILCGPVEVEIAGYQSSDGSTDRWISVDGDCQVLNPDEALMLATTLSRAADELERVEGAAW